MIKKRVMYLLEYKKIPKENFFKEVGISSANFRGEQAKRPLNSKAIESIVSKFPDLNCEWLITGKGEMLKPSSDNIDYESRPNATSAPKNYLAQYTDEELDQILQDQYRVHLLQMYEQGKAYPEIVVKKMMAEKDIQIKELQREVWELQKKLKQTADNDTIVAKDGKAE